MGDAVGAINPGGAHGARLRLSLSVHKVIDDERAIGFSEEFTETDCVHGHVTSVEVVRALFKLIVVNESSRGKMAAEFGDAFALSDELNFCEAKLLTLDQVLGRLVGQIGLPKRSVNYCMHHRSLLHA